MRLSVVASCCSIKGSNKNKSIRGLDTFTLSIIKIFASLNWWKTSFLTVKWNCCSIIKLDIKQYSFFSDVIALALLWLAHIKSCIHNMQHVAWHTIELHKHTSSLWIFLCFWDRVLFCSPEFLDCEILLFLPLE